MRIPGGDASSVWSVADAGGISPSVHNDSPAPIAVAFTRPDIATVDRLPTCRSTAIACRPAPWCCRRPTGDDHRRPRLPRPARRACRPAGADRPRGWITRTDAASRLDLPEPDPRRRGPGGALRVAARRVRRPADEPERHLLGVGELVRLGDLDAGALRGRPERGRSCAAPAPWSTAPRSRCRRRRARRGGRAPGVADLGRPPHGSDDEWLPRRGRRLVRCARIPMVERRLIAARSCSRLVSQRWRGTSFEAHRLVAGPSSRVSLAVRWHGAGTRRCCGRPTASPSSCRRP